MDAPFLDALSRLPLAPTGKRRNRPLPFVSRKNIKTITKTDTTMANQSDLENAWQDLRVHWAIEPGPKDLPATPVYSALRLLISPFLRPLLRWRINGADRIPRKGATILAANHLSHVDPIAVIAAARRTTYYLAKDGHFTNRWTRFIMRSTGQIETDREAGAGDALAGAARILESQRALGIFPEGTRSKRPSPPYLLPGKTGVARLAAAYPHATVVPVALVGTREVMQPQHHKWPRLYRRFDVNAGVGVSWLQWLGAEQGGNMTPAMLESLGKAEEHEIRSELARLYRAFTDQLMASLSALGAP